MNPKTKMKTGLNPATEKDTGSGVAGTAHASESSLKKDWLRPEEDEAWADL